MSEKKCTACKMSHDVSMFHKSSSSKDGLQSRCKPCANEASKWSQGMKREAKREMRNMFADADNTYMVAKRAEEVRHAKAVAMINIRFGKKVAKVAAATSEVPDGQTI